MIESLLFILICAIADRVRGTTAIGVWLFAYIVATQYDSNVYVLLAIVLGESAGWGAPLGAYLRGDQTQGSDLEWWQNKYLGEHVLLSLVVRGLLWGLPPALAGYYTGALSALFLLPIITISFVTAPMFVKRFSKDLPDINWKIQEFVRGGLIGTFIEIFK